MIGELDCRLHIGLNSDLKSKKRGYKVMVIAVQPASNYPPCTDPYSPIHGSYEYRNKLTREHKSKVHGYLFCSIFDRLMIDT